MVQQVQLLEVWQGMPKRYVVERLHPDQSERLEFAEVAPSVHSRIDVVALLVVQSRVDLSIAIVPRVSPCRSRKER